MVKYSPYGSRLNVEEAEKLSWFAEVALELLAVERQKEIKNSPTFYQQAPFLTIAEDLVKLIKEDKVEQLIFLVYCKVLDVKGEMQEEVIRDERIELAFKETFGKFPNCSLRKINYVEDDLGGVEVQRSKADWIKQNAPDFDLVIDDNPNVCRSLICRDCLEVKSDGEIALAPVECGKCPEMTVIAPYYPAVASQHDERVLLVKNEVSELKKEDFEQMKKLTAINEQKQEVDFGFAGKYRTQTNTSLSWNWEGKELFKRIPCGQCKKLFTEEDLRNNNYNLWTDERFGWIDKKLNLYWDRHLINYQVIDKENNCRNFPDGKQLVLKAAFIITDVTHKECK